MNFRILICFIFSIGLSLVAKAETWHYSYQCQIVDESGNLVKMYPGANCVFTENGYVISGSQASLRKFAADGGLIWKKQINTHHALKLVDQTSVLVMTSTVHSYKGEKVRFDRIGLYDLNGVETKHFDFFDHKDELLKIASKKDFWGAAFPYLSPYFTQEQKELFAQAKHEFSHLNSVYEIPENKIFEKINAFKRGNYLVNVNGLGMVFILDSDLQKILWSLSIPKADLNFGIHDVQVDKSGQYLLYYSNNFSATESSIEKIDPVTKKKTIIFKGTPENPFFGETQGSVEELENDRYLVSQFNSKLGNKIFTTKSGRLEWQMPALSSGNKGRPIEGLQEVKRLNLKSFLSHAQ